MFKQQDGKTAMPSIAFWLLGLIWGSNFLYMRLAAEYISPMQVVFLRVALAVLPVILYGVLTKSFKKAHWKYWPRFLVMSVLATVVYYYCFVEGSHLLYSGIAGAISGCSPIVVFLLGLAFLNEEKLSVYKVLGLMLGIVGVLLLAKPFNGSFSPTTWKGIAYMVVGCISFGSSFIYAKKYITPLEIPGAALTSYQLVGATLILLTVTSFSGMGHIFSDTKAAIGMVVGLGCLGTGLAYLIYYFIIHKMGAVKASSVAYIPPLVSLGIGATIGKEPIAPTDFLGAAIILAGVYFLRRK